MFLKPDAFDGTSLDYGFFGRKGGVREGIYASLNASLASGDKVEAVRENRARICERLNVEEILTPYQVHSPDCTIVNGTQDERIKGDALVTSVPGLAIGILTADCGPVLFSGEGANGKVIGAAHAGWGGALRGVLENTIAKMAEQGAYTETISACIGPCIGPDSYEVSDGFQTPFFEEDRDSIMYFKPGAQNKFWFDLPAYIRFRLKRAGIRNISLCGIDTYKEEADFFSFRRATHQNERDYGRQISAISIRPRS